MQWVYESDKISDQSSKGVVSEPEYIEVVIDGNVTLRIRLNHGGMT